MSCPFMTRGFGYHILELLTNHVFENINEETDTCHVALVAKRYSGDVLDAYNLVLEHNPRLLIPVMSTLVVVSFQQSQVVVFLQI